MSMADAIIEQIEHKLAIKKRIYSLDEAAEYLGLINAQTGMVRQNRRLSIPTFQSSAATRLRAPVSRMSGRQAATLEPQFIPKELAERSYISESRAFGSLLIREGVLKLRQPSRPPHSISSSAHARHGWGLLFR